ncbi:MAG: hypothetical protein CM1200mP3_03200 [Chloroflexota bacterium]|nr:MAG: hypothetical protein CM1200mP3_03200 [Chloroflexota bacterium]
MWTMVKRVLDTVAVSRTICEKIEVLLSNLDLKEFMSKAAIKRANQMSWGNVALRMEKYYESF